MFSLPRTNPGDRKEYKRRQRPLHALVMSATGGGNKLPYGNLPRLLLAWVCTEAVRTQRRELVLGRSSLSASSCVSWAWIPMTVVVRGGNRTRLRNQMDRLFTAQCPVDLRG